MIKWLEVSQEDKEDPKCALQVVMSQCSHGGHAVFDLTSSHCFSYQLVEDIANNSHKIFTINDIVSQFAIFSLFMHVRFWKLLMKFSWTSQTVNLNKLLNVYKWSLLAT